MKSVFADTFYWIALTSAANNNYEHARALKQEFLDTVLVTTDEVLSEFLNHFAGNFALRKRAGETVTTLRKAATIKIIPQSRASFDAGFELYQARSDKGYSLTDCISMQTMWHEDITEILTNDRHFEQEGFRALFRD